MRYIDATLRHQRPAAANVVSSPFRAVRSSDIRDREVVLPTTEQAHIMYCTVLFEAVPASALDAYGMRPDDVE
jgi:hypothetical protein